jgi:hypothetical protein
MKWNDVSSNLSRMKGLKLRSISGKSDITVVDLDRERIVVRTTSGEIKSRPLQELQRVVAEMDMLKAVHVDSVLRGSGSSRNQPETIIANLPDVEYIKLRGVKQVMWVGRITHELGTIREADPFTRSQLTAFVREKAASTQSYATKMIIVTRDIRLAHEFVRSLLQTERADPLEGSSAYVVRDPRAQVFLVPSESARGGRIHILPILNVVDTEGASKRIAALVPEATFEKIALDHTYTIISVASIPLLAMGQISPAHA